MTIRGKKGRIVGSLGINFFWGAVFLVFVVYVGVYAVKMYAREALPEAEVVFGSVNPPIVSRGVIVRDEALYKAPEAGVTVYSVADGERVKKGSVVCSVEDADGVAQKERELREINETILNRREKEESSLFAEDVKKANGSVKKAVDAAAIFAAPENIGAVYGLAEYVSDKISYRNAILYGAGVGDLRSELSYQKNLIGTLYNLKTPIKVNESGIFSTRADGYESDFTPETVYGISKEKTQVEGAVKNLALGRESTKEGDALFRIVRSNEWRVAAYIPEYLVADWRENSFITVQIERGGGSFYPYEAKVDKIELKTARDDGLAFVVLKFTKYMTEFIDERGISFKVAQGVTEGLKIPKTAVAEKTYVKIPAECLFKAEGETDAIRKIGEGGKEETIMITIKKRDESGAYVLLDYNKLKLGDVLSVKNEPGGYRVLTEISNTRGVFVTNSGSAVFCEIYESADYTENAEYILLNPAENKGLKAHDKIAADIRYLGKGIVY